MTLEEQFEITNDTQVRNERLTIAGLLNEERNLFEKQQGESISASQELPVDQGTGERGEFASQFPNMFTPVGERPGDISLDDRPDDRFNFQDYMNVDPRLQEDSAFGFIDKSKALFDLESRRSGLSAFELLWKGALTTPEYLAQQTRIAVDLVELGGQGVAWVASDAVKTVHGALTKSTSDPSWFVDVVETALLATGAWAAFKSLSATVVKRGATTSIIKAIDDVGEVARDFVGKFARPDADDVSPLLDDVPGSTPFEVGSKLPKEIDLKIPLRSAALSGILLGLGQSLFLNKSDEDFEFYVNQVQDLLDDKGDSSDENGEEDEDSDDDEEGTGDNGDGPGDDDPPIITGDGFIIIPGVDDGTAIIVIPGEGFIPIDEDRAVEVAAALQSILETGFVGGARGSVRAPDCLDIEVKDETSIARFIECVSKNKRKFEV